MLLRSTNCKVLKKDLGGPEGELSGSPVSLFSGLDDSKRNTPGTSNRNAEESQLNHLSKLVELSVETIAAALKWVCIVCRVC